MNEFQICGASIFNSSGSSGVTATNASDSFTQIWAKQSKTVNASGVAQHEKKKKTKKKTPRGVIETSVKGEMLSSTVSSKRFSKSLAEFKSQSFANSCARKSKERKASSLKIDIGEHRSLLEFEALQDDTPSPSPLTRWQQCYSTQTSIPKGMNDYSMETPSSDQTLLPRWRSSYELLESVTFDDVSMGATSNKSSPLLLFQNPLLHTSRTEFVDDDDVTMVSAMADTTMTLQDIDTSFNRRLDEVLHDNHHTFESSFTDGSVIMQQWFHSVQVKANTEALSQKWKDEHFLATHPTLGDITLSNATQRAERKQQSRSQLIDWPIFNDDPMQSDNKQLEVDFLLHPKRYSASGEDDEEFSSYGEFNTKHGDLSFLENLDTEKQSSAGCYDGCQGVPYSASTAVLVDTYEWEQLEYITREEPNHHSVQILQSQQISQHVKNLTPLFVAMLRRILLHHVCRRIVQFAAHNVRQSEQIIRTFQHQRNVQVTRTMVLNWRHYTNLQKQKETKIMKDRKIEQIRTIFKCWSSLSIERLALSEKAFMHYNFKLKTKVFTFWRQEDSQPIASSWHKIHLITHVFATWFAFTTSELKQKKFAENKICPDNSLLLTSTEHRQRIPTSTLPNKHSASSHRRVNMHTVQSSNDRGLCARNKPTVSHAGGKGVSLKIMGGQPPNVLDTLERRAEERAIKMKGLQERYAAKKKLQDEENSRNIDSHNASAQQCRDTFASQRAMQKAEQQRRRELWVEKWKLACLHSQVALLKRTLKMWACSLERWKVQFEKSRLYREERLQRNYWNSWICYVKELQRKRFNTKAKKMQVSACHFREVLLRKTCVAWCNHTRLVSLTKRELCETFCHAFFLRRQFITWRKYTVIKKVEAAVKDQKAASLGDRNQRRRTLQRWKNVTELQKMERKIEVEVAAKWVDVRRWLRNADNC